MLDIQEQLRSAQARAKALSSRKDQILRDAGIEEQKLKQVYESLKQLGVPRPESLSEGELKELEEDSRKKLDASLEALLKALSEGESLLAEYDRLQG